MKRPKLDANSKLQRYKIESQSSLLDVDELCEFQSEDRELNLEGPKTEVECLMEIHLENIETILKEMQCERELDNEQEDEEEKFKFAALVMDRFFFLLAFTYSLVTFGALVMTNKNFYKFQ